MRLKAFRKAAVALLLVCQGSGLWADSDLPFLTGVDSNYYLEFKEDHGAKYKYHGQPVDDYFGLLNSIGVNAARVRVFATRDRKAESHISYATRTAKLAAEKGMHIILAVFLSDGWSDVGKQPASTRWSRQDLREMCDSVRKYCHTVAQHFVDAGVPIAVYAVGNEVDFGISGFFPEDFWQGVLKRETQFWDEEAQIVAAGQAGIKEVVPDAKFLHHLSLLWDFDFLSNHFQFMRDHGVQIDYLGLSFYASALHTHEIGEILPDSLTYFKANAASLHDKFDLPIIVPEWAYPAEPVTDGMFSPQFNHPIEAYPATANGQAQYVADFLTWCKTSGFMAGAFYFSPEFATVPHDFWRFMSLFDHDLNARPGLDALDGQISDSTRAERAAKKETE